MKKPILAASLLLLTLALAACGQTYSAAAPAETTTGAGDSVQASDSTADSAAPADTETQTASPAEPPVETSAVTEAPVTEPQNATTTETAAAQTTTVQTTTASAETTITSVSSKKRIAGNSYEFWNGFSYAENGQVRYQLETYESVKLGFTLHCWFREGSPEWHEEMITLTDLTEGAQEVTVGTVLDSRGHDLTGQFRSFHILFGEDCAIMEIEREPATLAGSVDSSIQSGSYRMTE